MGGFNQDFVDSGQMRVLEEVGADQIWILQNVDLLLLWYVADV